MVQEPSLTSVWHTNYFKILESSGNVFKIGRFLDINPNVPSLEVLAMLPVNSHMTIVGAEEQRLDMRPACQGPHWACFPHLYACTRP